jgi:hypothetical protein
VLARCLHGLRTQALRALSRGIAALRWRRSAASDVRGTLRRAQQHSDFRPVARRPECCGSGTEQAPRGATAPHACPRPVDGAPASSACASAGTAGLPSAPAQRAYRLAARRISAPSCAVPPAALWPQCRARQPQQRVPMGRRCGGRLSRCIGLPAARHCGRAGLLVPLRSACSEPFPRTGRRLS